MSTNVRFIEKFLPLGEGIALDLGGGNGGLRHVLEKLGYCYVNVDFRHFDGGEPTFVGDAHDLPLKDNSVSLVVSKDSLEHLKEPLRAVSEAHRVLKRGGKAVIWVPFMHPFHGDDYWRFTPLMLKEMLKEFSIERFDSPQWVFSVMGMAVSGLAKQMGMGLLSLR